MEGKIINPRQMHRDESTSGNNHGLIPDRSAAPKELNWYHSRSPRNLSQSSQRFGHVETGCSLGLRPKPWPPLE